MSRGSPFNAAFNVPLLLVKFICYLPYHGAYSLTWKQHLVLQKQYLTSCKVSQRRYAHSRLQPLSPVPVHRTKTPSQSPQKSPAMCKKVAAIQLVKTSPALPQCSVPTATKPLLSPFRLADQSHNSLLISPRSRSLADALPMLYHMLSRD